MSTLRIEQGFITPKRRDLIMATVRVFNHHLHSSFYWLIMVDAILFVLAFYAGTYLYFLSEPGSFQNYLGQIPARRDGPL